MDYLVNYVIVSKTINLVKLLKIEHLASTKASKP